MKQSLRRDTLAFQLGIRPALRFRNLGQQSARAVGFAMKEFMDSGNIYGWLGPDANSMKEGMQGDPERDALVFYMLNHAVSLVRQRVHPLQPLGKYLPILDLYHREVAVRGARLFYYLLLICAREARHEKGGHGMEALYSKYGKALKPFINSFPDSSSSALTYYVENCPEVSIGTLTSFLADQFYKGSYSSMFGGAKWGKIAEVLRDFCIGKFSAEMMMDTGFTLAHNTDPIFNKGMLYSASFGDIIKILDVQRSGQIPQFVAENLLPTKINGPVKAFWAACRELLGEEFDGYVDWFQVEALGAVGSYQFEKSAQLKKHGPSKYEKPVKATKGGGLKIPVKPEYKEPEGDPDEFDNDVTEDLSYSAQGPKVYIFPDQYIVKGKRK